MADFATVARLKEQALEMRKLICRLSHQTTVHLGGDLSMADMMTALYMYKMRRNDKDVKWPGRDRFVLSKGHGSACLYFAMAMAGYGSVEEIFKTYGRLGSRYGMHPCKNQNPAMEISSGSLGHGLPICCGMARVAKERGDKHYVFVMMGDGEIQEGSVWEAAMAASHYKLGNLVAFVDRNGISLSAPTEDTQRGMRLEPLADKWRAFGWNVVQIDGNNMEEIVDALDRLPPEDSDIPTVVLATTVKGMGVTMMENNENWHHGMLDSETLTTVLAELEEKEGKRHD